MKKLLILLVLLIPSVAFALPNITVPAAPGAGYWLISTSSGAYIASSTNPLTAGSFYATTTLASQFPYASTTALSAVSLCLTGDTCRTTWPSGGGGGAWPWNMLTTYATTTDATTTPAWFQTGFYASSTSQIVYASTTALSATTLCLTGDTCRTTWPSGSGSGAWPWTTLTNFGTSTDATTTAYTAPAYFASSTLASQFPYASTTALSATTLCLTGDTCRTTWPSGGGGVTSLAATYPLLVSGSTGAITASIFATSSASLYADVNRIDTYTSNGNYLTPFKTVAATIAAVAANGLSAFSLNLAPGTYVDGAPDTFPNVPFNLQGNESTLVEPSGVTFPNSFDIYDLTLVGNVHESDNTLTTIHQFNNGVISGNLQVDGNATLSGEAITGGLNVVISPGSLSNIVGNYITNPIWSSGVLNLNDNEVATNTPAQYAITATSTAFLPNGQFGNVNVLGATIINTSSGGAINVSNGATSTPNNLTAFTMLTGGASLTAGTALTDACDFESSNLMGAFVAPTGSNWLPCYDEKLNVLTGATTTQLTITGTAWDSNLSASHLLSLDNNGQIVATSSIGTSLLTGTVGVANGGTGASTFAAGQLLFGDGTLALGQNSSLFYATSTGAFVVGTTTAQYGLATLGTSTAPQLMFSDNVPADPLWSIRSTGTNLYVGTSTALATSSPSILQVGSAYTSGNIFAVASSSNQVYFAVSAVGQIIGSTTVPTLSSCGTTPSVRGDDQSFTITAGSVSASGCTVTFGTPFPDTPHCNVTNQTMSVVNALTYTESTTQLVISQTALTGDLINI